MNDNKEKLCKDCKYWEGIGFAENAGWCNKEDVGTLYCYCCDDFKDKNEVLINEDI